LEEKQSNRLIWANKLIFVHKYEEAYGVLTELTDAEEGSDSLLAHLRRIELAAKLKKLPLLEKQFNKKLESNPKNYGVRLCLVMIKQLGEFIEPEQAVAEYQEVLNEDPTNAAAYYCIGFSLEMMGEIERAIYNYEQSINHDADWYPSYFGLSQLHYQLGNAEDGDRHFYQFEQGFPYNVYGNFETHQALCQEFCDLERYEDAETSVTTLGEWWVGHRGHCPSEVKIYENFAISEIKRLSKDGRSAELFRSAGVNLCDKVLSDPSPEEGILYYVAKILEEYDELEYALKFYRKTLQSSTVNQAMIQKIGSQFLSTGRYEMARDLFEDAYLAFPDNQEVRFCLLVSKLRLADVDVENYLLSKERLKHLLASDSDRVEVLSVLHNLLAQFKEDPEVHYHLGDLYLRMENIDRASNHYQKMFDLDGSAKKTALRFASFLMHRKDPQKSLDILNRLERDGQLTDDDAIEINWLKASYYARLENYEKSQSYLNKVTCRDPWNVSYLAQEIVNKTFIAPVGEDIKVVDSVTKNLLEMDERSLDWSEFDEVTKQLDELMLYDLCYTREKVRYLYSDGDQQALLALIESVKKFDPKQGTFDFVRLINTNFDSPLVYWALGIMYKELWQLEVARMWFEQTISHPDVFDGLRAKCYVEIADCCVWLSKELNNAVEFSKMALDMGLAKDHRAITVLSHAYIKTGQMKRAENYLSLTDQEAGDGLEYTFLKGLLEYRNGSTKLANKIWKPLLTAKSENIRSHNIKQEILRFYFDGEPYLSIN